MNDSQAIKGRLQARVLDVGEEGLSVMVVERGKASEHVVKEHAQVVDVHRVVVSFQNVYSFRCNVFLQYVIIYMIYLIISLILRQFELINSLKDTILQAHKTHLWPLRNKISGAKKATEPQKDFVPRWPTPSLERPKSVSSACRDSSMTTLSSKPSQSIIECI